MKIPAGPSTIPLVRLLSLLVSVRLLLSFRLLLSSGPLVLAQNSFTANAPAPLLEIAPVTTQAALARHAGHITAFYFLRDLARSPTFDRM